MAPERRRLIFLRYARGMMLIDFLAVFPFGFFVPKSRASFSGTYLNTGMFASEFWDPSQFFWQGVVTGVNVP